MFEILCAWNAFQNIKTRPWTIQLAPDIHGKTNWIIAKFDVIRLILCLDCVNVAIFAHYLDFYKLFRLSKCFLIIQCFTLSKYANNCLLQWPLLVHIWILTQVQFIFHWYFYAIFSSERNFRLDHFLEWSFKFDLISFEYVRVEFERKRVIKPFRK